MNSNIFMDKSIVKWEITSTLGWIPNGRRQGGTNRQVAKETGCVLLNSITVNCI